MITQKYNNQVALIYIYEYFFNLVQHCSYLNNNFIIILLIVFLQPGNFQEEELFIHIFLVKIYVKLAFKVHYQVFFYFKIPSIIMVCFMEYIPIMFSIIFMINSNRKVFETIKIIRKLFQHEQYKKRVKSCHIQYQNNSIY